jgi:phosphate transport system protein
MQRLLDEHLDKLKTRIIKMCSLVDEQVQLAIKAVEADDLEMAKYAIDMDKKVNKFDVKIDKICQKIFALSQPVAMDLRYIMSSSRSIIILSVLVILQLTFLKIFY